MGFSDAQDSMKAYRTTRKRALIGEEPNTWFTDTFSDISDMLETFETSEENSVIEAGYADEASKKLIPPGIKLAYLCGLRREVRKQYVSGESGLYTDVTPFRHSAMSVHAANLFDSITKTIVSRS